MIKLTMRKFFNILVLSLFLTTPTLSNDIKDFEIEGISIGDSLLNHFSKEKITNAVKTIFPGSKKFYSVHFLSDSNIYDQFSFTIKSDDKKYILYALSGDIWFEDDLKGCLKQKEIIVEEVSAMFSNIKKNTYTHKYKTVADGKSFSKVTDLSFKDGSDIRIFCNSYSKETEKLGYKDMLSVNISTSELTNWINSEAY
tara:strand:+ start:229 stop:822 length:594 start_codon:yes stop_codon:yes gene_type:complete